MILNFNWHAESFPLAQTFRTSRGAKTEAKVLVLEVSYATANQRFRGWAEAVPYARYGESIASVSQALAVATETLNESMQNRRLNASPATVLQELVLSMFVPTMPAGSARNLIDCACWDLLAKINQSSVADMLSLQQPESVVCAQTLSVDSLESMQSAAAKLAHLPLLKVKLDKTDIVSKMQAISTACPNSKFIIDANEAWDIETLQNVTPSLQGCNVVLIEQPLAADDDDALLGFASTIPLCADESCHISGGLEELAKKYQAINIKLDKTGGLSEALHLLSAAKHHNLQVMLGCMVGSSLAMAPIYLLTGQADFVDLDGPVLVAKDRENGFIFKNGIMSTAPEHLWGMAK